MYESKDNKLPVLRFTAIKSFIQSYSKDIYHWKRSSSGSTVVYRPSLHNFLLIYFTYFRQQLLYRLSISFGAPHASFCFSKYPERHFIKRSVRIWSCYMWYPLTSHCRHPLHNIGNFSASMYFGVMNFVSVAYIKLGPLHCLLSYPWFFCFFLLMPYFPIHREYKCLMFCVFGILQLWSF